MKDLKIGVIGLGYVGLPLALHLARHFKTTGFDIDEKKVSQLKSHVDVLNEGLEAELKVTTLYMSSNSQELKDCNFYIVGVPTPVDENSSPDLSPLRNACNTIGAHLKKGDIVVFESTVYPGLTEDICGPCLEKASGLRSGIDFKLGYSPERMNPGDGEHSLTQVVKIVSGQDAEALEVVSAVYSSVVKAGVHRAPSIKVAEAAKVIENVQRDLNIALMNELAIIFDLIGIPTRDVLEAAASKWNFVHFKPGLVGGHCIGVDPYYLTTKAEQLKYNPQVILAGRRINDGMGRYVAQKLVKLMINANLSIKDARIGVLGITFKENVSDIRNSRVPDIIEELKQFGVVPIVHDPHADPSGVSHEYGIGLSDLDELKNLDALVLAVSHKEYVAIPQDQLCMRIRNSGVLIDVKSMLDRKNIPKQITYWAL